MSMWVLIAGYLYLSSPVVYDIAKSGDALWIATPAGVWVWGWNNEPRGPVLTREHLSGIPRVLVPSYERDELWVGTSRSLDVCVYVSRFVPKTPPLPPPPECMSVVFAPVHDIAVVNHPISAPYRAFLATPNGLILLGAEEGLREVGRLNRQAGIPLLSDTLTSLFLHGDTLWVGTLRGLHRVPVSRLNQVDAWGDTLLTGQTIHDVLVWGGVPVVATDQGVWLDGGWVHQQEPAYRLVVENDTLFFSASPAGIYAMPPGALQARPLFPLEGYSGGPLARTPDGAWLWGDRGGWPGPFPQEGNGLWLDTQRVVFGSRDLPARQVADMVEDGEGNLWGIFWNREGLPDLPSGWVWVYIPREDRVLASPLPQPFQLAPHPVRGVWIAHYRWDGGGTAGAYHAYVDGGNLQVDSIDLGTSLVMALAPWGNGGLVYGYYQGGSSGKFGVRIWFPDGTLRSVTEGLSELWRVESRAVLRGCGDRIVVGSHGQGVWVLDENGGTVAHLSTASGLPSDEVLEVLCAGDTLWVLTPQGLVRVEALTRITGRLPLSQPVAMVQGLGFLWVLSEQDLLKVSPDLQVLERWSLETSTLPGELFPSTTLRIRHRPLAVMNRWSYVAVATTSGVYLLSFADRDARAAAPWTIWPHPVRGREFFLEGPPVDRILLFSPEGRRIPLRVDHLGQRLRIQLLIPPTRGPYWLVVEGENLRHTQIVLFTP